MTHYSGLAPDLDLRRRGKGKTRATNWHLSSRRRQLRDRDLFIAIINFITLGAIVEKVSGESLDEYATKAYFCAAENDADAVVPPESWRRRKLRRRSMTRMSICCAAWCTIRRPADGRRAGHAGLFSTGDDLAKFAQALLNGGDGILSADTVEKMTSPETPPQAPVLRGFGWDIDSPFSSNSRRLVASGSFGHTGFTGTSVWIDPTTETYIILLTNSVHPRGKGNAIGLRTKVATEVAASLALNPTEKEEMQWKSITGYNEALSASRRMSARNGDGEDWNRRARRAWVRCAAASGWASGKKRIGVVTNQTGIDSQGVRTIDVWPRRREFR